MTWPEPTQPFADWCLTIGIAAVIIGLAWLTSRIFNWLMGVIQ